MLCEVSSYLPCLYLCIISLLKEEVGRLKQSHDEDEVFTVLPQEFRVMLTHIQSLTYSDTPDYNLVLDVFTQAITRLGK